MNDLSDSEVLARAGNMGPGILGRELFERAQAVRKRTGGGVFGPAIVDPDYGKDRAAASRARLPAAEPPVPDAEDDDEDDAPTSAAPDPAAPVDVADPWAHVTLSGAKMLAMEKQVSYQPRVKRAELVASLIAAGVQPPPKLPDLPDDDPESPA